MEHRDAARRIGGEKIQFVLHILLGKRRMRWCARSTSEWEEGQGEDGHNFTPETYLSSSISAHATD